MPSTFTSDLRLELQADGEHSATWGQKLNSNHDLTEDAISGMTTVTTTGGTYTLSVANAAADEARRAILKITGVLVSNSTIVIPAVTKKYTVWNATSGAFTVTVKTSGGTGVAVTQGKIAGVFCDGTDTRLDFTDSVAAGFATLVGTEALTNKTAAAATNTIEARSGPGVSQFSHRNKIINGGVDITQRGTSFTGVSSSIYAADRWRIDLVSSAVVTVTQQADAPSDNEFQSSLRVAVTTADASIAAGDFWTLRQRIEGYNARDLIGRTFTLSFWVRSAKTGIHCVAFRNSGADRSYVLEYTINAVNTWEKKTLTVVGGLITAGTWDWTTGLGVDVVFPLAAGSTYQTTAGAWQTGLFIATSSQVNVLDTIGNIFAITGVQLEAGDVATPFEHRPYGVELALCQRYYERGFDTTASFPATYLHARALNHSASNSDVLISAHFAVRKRTVPTVSARGDVQDGAEFSITVLVSTTAGFTVSRAAVPAGQWLDLNDWEATAEL